MPDPRLTRRSLRVLGTVQEPLPGVVERTGPGSVRGAAATPPPPAVQSMVGMTKLAPSLMPDGQREVTVLVRV